MTLSPRARIELIEALRHAFDPDEFDMMLWTSLRRRRHDIVDHTGFEITVFEVIQDAEQKGWTRDLIRAALEERGGNERLQKFASDYPEYGLPATSVLINAHILYITASPGEVIPTPSSLDLSHVQVLKQQMGNASEVTFKPGVEGVVGITYGDLALLLKLGIHISMTIKIPDAGRLRLGLHTAVCEAGTSGSKTPKVPAEEVDIARRVAELGSAGHILVTGEAATLLSARSDLKSLFEDDFDSLFHEPLRCELRPPRPSVVHNFYRTLLDAGGQRMDFGNEGLPRTKAPEQVIKSFLVPPLMRVMRKEQIKVVFCPEVSYFVKVQFEFKGIERDHISISCTKSEGPDCTFEYDFEDPGEGREHLISIQVINAEKDQNFSVRMLCLDRHDEQIIIPRSQPIKLRRSFLRWLWELILLWLREKFWPSPWYVKGVPVAALVLAAGLYIMILRLYPKPPPPPPSEFTANWIEDFSAEEIKNLNSRWDFAEGQVVPVNGEEVKVVQGQEGPPVGAILVKGPGMVLAKVDESKKLYKLMVRFKIRFVEGEKAAWVFRAQNEKRSGYVFVLHKSGSDLLMSGYKAPNPENRFDNQVRRIPVQCCHPNDAFIITAEVEGGTIRHSVRVVNTTALRAGVNTPDPYSLAAFTDENNIYPFGDAGFVGSDDSQMKVEFWYLNQLGVSAASSPSPVPLRAAASISVSSPHRMP